MAHSHTPTHFQTDTLDSILNEEVMDEATKAAKYLDAQDSNHMERKIDERSKVMKRRRDDRVVGRKMMRMEFEGRNNTHNNGRTHQFNPPKNTRLHNSSYSSSSSFSKKRINLSDEKKVEEGEVLSRPWTTRDIIETAFKNHLHMYISDENPFNDDIIYDVFQYVQHTRNSTCTIHITDSQRTVENLKYLSQLKFIFNGRFSKNTPIQAWNKPAPDETRKFVLSQDHDVYIIGHEDVKVEPKAFFACTTRILLFHTESQQVLWTKDRDSRKWGFPGGFVNDGESPSEGACRELAEEVGIKLRPEGLRQIGCEYHAKPAIYGQKDDIEIFYVKLWKGKLPDVYLEEAEVEGYRWIHVDKIKEFSPESRFYFRNCLKMIDTFKKMY